MKNKNILSLSEIKKAQIARAAKATESKDLIDGQIEYLQQKARNEFKAYEEMTELYINSVRNLAVFNDVMADEIRSLLIEYLYEGFVKPLFDGSITVFMEHENVESSSEIRENMYKMLYNKYILSPLDGGDVPF